VSRPIPQARGERALLVALSSAALTYSLMQSLVIPALPAIQRSLKASPDATSWMVTGFLLSSSVATPIAGRLGDMFGKRRVLLGVGGGLGVIIAGFLVEHVSYTSMFWLQLPAFASVAYCIHRFVPESSVTAPARIDWVGAALVSVGLVAALITVTQARRWGVGSPRTILGTATAAVFLAAWAHSALRRSEPLLDLRLLRRRPVWTTT
jgi:MFS family permease